MKQLFRLVPGTALALMVLATSGSAQARCTDANLKGLMMISVGLDFETPPGATRAFIPATATLPANELSVPAGGLWKISQSDYDKLAEAQSASRTGVQFGTATGVLCSREFSVNPDDTGGGNRETPGASSSAAMTPYDTPEECASKAGPKWESEIKARRARQPGHFTLLIFLESGNGTDANICYYNRDYGVAGDPIYVGVFRKAYTWTAARFEPCAIQAAAPNILQSSDKFPTGFQSGEWKLQEFLPRRCFNAAVDVSVVGKNRDSTVTQRYPLSQYDRYRATLQAGILFSNLHDGDFALRADQADTSKKFIFDKGPTNRGPEYIATLQLYSFLKYLPSLLRGPGYPGRDPINDQGFEDRLGLILGSGIKNPGKRFVAGLSFELIYGVSAIGVIDFAKISQVHDSVSTTVPFKGAAADIPTVLVWKHKVTFGLSIDLRYLATLFTGNR